MMADVNKETEMPEKIRSQNWTWDVSNDKHPSEGATQPQILCAHDPVDDVKQATCG